MNRTKKGEIMKAMAIILAVAFTGVTTFAGTQAPVAVKAEKTTIKAEGGAAPAGEPAAPAPVKGKKAKKHGKKHK